MTIITVNIPLGTLALTANNSTAVKTVHPALGTLTLSAKLSHGIMKKSVALGSLNLSTQVPSTLNFTPLYQEIQPSKTFTGVEING